MKEIFKKILNVLFNKKETDEDNSRLFVSFGTSLDD